MLTQCLQPSQAPATLDLKGHLPAARCTVHLAAAYCITSGCLCCKQALFRLHRTRTAVLPATAKGPALLTVRLTNYQASELHIRQLKSNSIGGSSSSRVSTTQQYLTCCGSADLLPAWCRPCQPTHFRVKGLQAYSKACSMMIVPRFSALYQHLVGVLVSAGKLATLKGTVTRMSHVRPLITEMDFSCNKCGTSFPTALPDGRFTPPTRCAGVTKPGPFQADAPCNH